MHQWIMLNMEVPHICAIIILDGATTQKTSWNTSYNTLQSPQVQRSSLEEAMDELRRTEAAFTMAQPEFSRSMDEMDYSQVGLPQFFNPNEISQPQHERMTKLEAALIEMKRVHA